MFTFDHRLGFHQAFFQVYRLSRPVIQLAKGYLCWKSFVKDVYIYLIIFH
jgi:hypothetical protein